MKRPSILLTLCVVGAAPLGAQVRAEFTPRIGAFVPLEDRTAATDALGNVATTRAQTRFAIGARLGVWLVGNFGVEGTVEYAESGQTAFLNGVPQVTTPGHLFATSGRGMISIGEPDGLITLILSGGGGLVVYGGEAFVGLAGRAEWAPAAGVGLRVRVTPDVAVRVDVDGYTYRPEFTNVAGQTVAQERQYDLWITFGLTGRFKRNELP